jgi:hypothetical protein
LAFDRSCFPDWIKLSGHDFREFRKSSIAIRSPRLKTQQLFAINREELFLFGRRWFAMETSIEIAVQFDEQNQLVPFGVQRNRLFIQQLRSSNPVATLAGSIDADKR